jgi:ATP-binding cassette, subfamily B, bacterial MsbA
LPTTIAETSSRVLYGRLLERVKPHWRIFGVAILGMVLTAATEPLFPALMKTCWTRASR